MLERVVDFRQMQMDDLPLVTAWLGAPHVSRWWLAGSTVEEEIGDLRQSIAGAQSVHALIVSVDDQPIGWCQWYPCRDDPAWAADVGAHPSDIGIDYAIGDPARVGTGIGTTLIAELVRLVRSQHPSAGVIADPHEGNTASRRVLEKNGFSLVRVAILPSEPGADPMAIYRLPGPTALHASPVPR